MIISSLQWEFGSSSQPCLLIAGTKDFKDENEHREFRQWRKKHGIFWKLERSEKAASFWLWEDFSD